MDNIETKLCELSRTRVIVPQLPDDVKDRLGSEDILWHNKESISLERKLGEATGLFIRNEMCMFIPSPSFEKLFLFKELKLGKNPVSEETLENIGKVALYHMQKIESLIDELPGPSGKAQPIELIFVLYAIKLGEEPIITKTKDAKLRKKYKKHFEKQFQGANFRQIIPSCLSVEESKINDEFVTGNANRSSQNNTLRNMAKRFLEPEVFGLEPSMEVFRLPGDSDLKFTDRQLVQQRFKDLLRNDCLHLLPDIHRLPDHLLFHTDEAGRLKSTDQHFGYSGEIHSFYQEKFVSKLEGNTTGIFLRDFQPPHIRNLFAWPHFRNYQIDWLFLGRDQIVVFEIGMLKDPKNVRDAVNKKLKQVKDNLIPFMVLLLWGLERSYESVGSHTKEAHEFWEVFESKVSFVIFFPNADVQALRSYLTNRSKSNQKVPSEPKCLVTCPNSEGSSDKGVKAFVLGSKDQIDKNVKLGELLTKTGRDLMSSETKGDNSLPSFKTRLSLITQLLTLSFLTVVDNPWKPLDIDERYDVNYEKELSKFKTPPAKINGRNLILTPEQHTILQKGEKFSIIHGEAGTGKTSLLLMKAIQLSSDPEVGKILYIVPDEKKELKSYLQKILATDSILKEKLEVCSFTLELLVFSGLECPDNLARQIRDKTSGCKGVALLIDEFYFDAALPFLFYPASHCWIIYVTHGRKVPDLSMDTSERFIREKLENQSAVEAFIPQLIEMKDYVEDEAMERELKFCNKFCELFLHEALLKDPNEEVEQALVGAVIQLPDEPAALMHSCLYGFLEFDELYLINKRPAKRPKPYKQNEFKRLRSIINRSIQFWAHTLNPFFNAQIRSSLKKMIGEKFSEEHLHVLVRSARRISEMGHGIIHKLKNFDETTASTTGTFVSSQPLIQISTFERGRRKRWNFQRLRSFVPTWKLFKKHYAKLNPKFSSSRFVVILTSVARLKLWKNVKRIYHGESKFFIIEGSQHDLNSLSFTGAESMSTLIIIDVAAELGEKEKEKKNSELLQFCYAAMTRACYEVIIVIDESQVDLIRAIREANVITTLYHCIMNGDAIPLFSNSESYLELYSLVESLKENLDMRLKVCIDRSSKHVQVLIVWEYFEKFCEMGEEERVVSGSTDFRNLANPIISYIFEQQTDSTNTQLTISSDQGNSAENDTLWHNCWLSWAYMIDQFSRENSDFPSLLVDCCQSKGERILKPRTQDVQTLLDEYLIPFLKNDVLRLLESTVDCFLELQTDIFQSSSGQYEILSLLNRSFQLLLSDETCSGLRERISCCLENSFIPRLASELLKRIPNDEVIDITGDILSLIRDKAISFLESEIKCLLDHALQPFLDKKAQKILIYEIRCLLDSIRFAPDSSLEYLEDLKGLLKLKLQSDWVSTCDALLDEAFGSRSYDVVQSIWNTLLTFQVKQRLLVLIDQSFGGIKVNPEILSEFHGKVGCMRPSGKLDLYADPFSPIFPVFPSFPVFPVRSSLLESKLENLVPGDKNSSLIHFMRRFTSLLVHNPYPHYLPKEIPERKRDTMIYEIRRLFTLPEDA